MWWILTIEAKKQKISVTSFLDFYPEICVSRPMAGVLIMLKADNADRKPWQWYLIATVHTECIVICWQYLLCQLYDIVMEFVQLWEYLALLDKYK